VNTRKILLASLLSLFCATAASARDSLERGSAASVGGSMVVGSVAALSAIEASELTVKAVQASAQGTVLVLQRASDGAEFSVRTASELGQAIGVSVGSAVQVVAESTGHVLVASGKVLAFIPNELGRALLHHSRY
jgi:hypothetical protein